MYNCELLSVGTEILLGDILNTNSQYLARELAALGIAVLHQNTVGDNQQRLREEIEVSLSRSDIIIATGGLGPTADDITKEVCCESLGFELVRDESILNDISAFFCKRGTCMPPTNAKQADVPKGGTVFVNSCGTAPGGAIEKDGKCIIFLPGPPREMKAMFEKQVKPFLISKYSDGAIVSHNIRTFGIGESAMAEAVSDLLSGKNPTVAPYAKDGEALLRVTAKAATKDEAEAILKPVIDDIRARLGNYVYSIDSQSIQETVVSLLHEKGLKVALAESCTAGYIAKRITEIPGASQVFECGIVSYSNKVKMQLLSVKKATLDAHGAVSAETAVEMARGVRLLSGADFGLSVTGVAGPGSDAGINAGVSFIGISSNDGDRAVKFETSGRNGREYIRYVTSSNALNLLREQILKNY